MYFVCGEETLSAVPLSSLSLLPFSLSLWRRLPEKLPVTLVSIRSSQSCLWRRRRGTLNGTWRSALPLSCSRGGSPHFSPHLSSLCHCLPAPPAHRHGQAGMAAGSIFGHCRGSFSLSSHFLKASRSASALSFLLPKALLLGVTVYKTISCSLAHGTRKSSSSSSYPPPPSHLCPCTQPLHTQHTHCPSIRHTPPFALLGRERGSGCSSSILSLEGESSHSLCLKWVSTWKSGDRPLPASESSFLEGGDGTSHLESEVPDSSGIIHR